jgi:hypothetical protein
MRPARSALASALTDAVIRFAMVEIFYAYAK